MTNNSREKVWKETTNAKPKSIIKKNDDDIANLNNDNSFAPIVETEEKEPLTDEEKQEVRKKLFVLLVLIIAVLFLLVIILFLEPFSSKNTDIEDTVIKEEKEEEEDTDGNITLDQLDDGSIDLSNEEIQKLESEIVFRQYEYYENDTIFLYESDVINISSLSNKNKLFLLSKTVDFNDLIRNMITDNSICDSSLKVKVSEIDKLLLTRFNTTITSYDTFIYNYYEDNSYISTIQFTKTDNDYIGKCYTPNQTITSLSQQSLISATKEDNLLYVDTKVVFVKESGVYKDVTFNTLITADKTKVLDEYIGEGNTYRYTYDISGSDYYLISVALVK